MKIFKRILFLLLLLILGAIFYNYSKLNIIAGYAAKNMASTVFVAGRTAHSVNNNDNKVPLIKLATTELNLEQKSVSASVFGLMTRQAVYREGLGSVLINDESALINTKPRRTTQTNESTFPFGNRRPADTLFANVDYSRLKSAMDNAFSNSEIQKTRTLLVVYKGHILGEHYADGFTQDTPVLGWSMTKSVMATAHK